MNAVYDYEVLSDAQKRQEYNVCWSGIRSAQAADQDAEAERKRAEAERAKNQEANARGPSQSAFSKARLKAIKAMRKAHEAEKQRYEREIERQREQLRDLREKVMHESKIFKLRRVVTRLNAELKRLDEQDEEDGKKDAQRNSWWTYFSSSIFRTERDKGGKAKARHGAS